MFLAGDFQILIGYFDLAKNLLLTWFLMGFLHEVVAQVGLTVSAINQRIQKPSQYLQHCRQVYLYIKSAKGNNC